MNNQTFKATVKAALVLAIVALVGCGSSGAGDVAKDAGVQDDADICARALCVGDGAVEAQVDAADAGVDSNVDAGTDAPDVIDAGDEPDANTVDAANDAPETDANDAGIDTGVDAGTDSGTDANDAGVDVVVIDAGSDANIDSGTDANVTDAGTDTGVDAGTDAGLDSGTDANDAGSDTGIDSGTDSGVDSGTDSGTDAGTTSSTFKCGTWTEDPAVANLKLSVSFNQQAPVPTNLYNFKICGVGGGKLYGIGNTKAGEADAPAATEVYEYNTATSSWDGLGFSVWATHYDSIVCGSNGSVYFVGRRYTPFNGEDVPIVGGLNTVNGDRFFDYTIPANTMGFWFLGTPDDGTTLYIGLTTWSLDNKLYKWTKTGFTSANWVDLNWSNPPMSGNFYFAPRGATMVGSDLLVYGAWYDSTNVSSPPSTPTIYRYNGATWSRFYGTNSATIFSQVSGTSLNDIFVTGWGVAEQANVVGHLVNKSALTLESDGNTLQGFEGLLSAKPGTYLTGGTLKNQVNGNIRLWSHDADGTNVVGPLDSKAFAPDWLYKEPDSDIVHMTTDPGADIPRHYSAVCH